jgi:hypothetical protein
MRKLLFLFALLGGCGINAQASVELSFADSVPETGKAQEVSLSGVDQPQALHLKVVYSPSSETQMVEEIGRFSESGNISWKPARPGIATLSARDDADKEIVSSNVAIYFSSTPMAGVLVMLLAGALLFGGAGVSTVFALRK